VVLLAFFLVSCDKVKDVFQEKDLLQRPVAKRCSECHENIYNQWKESRHAVLGHNVPTADHGNPKYYVDVIFYKDGKEVYSDSSMITPKEAFLPQQEKVINIPISVDYDKIKVNLSRKLSWQKEPEKIASYDF
jgi:hypothetical protein